MKPSVLLTLLRGVERLAEALLDRADLEIVVLYDLAAQHLEKRGIPCRRFDEFMTDGLRDRAALETARRAKAVGMALYGPEMRRAWAQYDDAAYDVLAEQVMNTLRHSFFEEIRLIETLRRCASQTDLRLIVVHQDICRDTKTLVQTGHRLGIPAFHLVHGYPYGGINSITMRDPSCADIVAVFSERLRETYLELGLPADRLVVTGNPEWDIYARPPVPGHKQHVCGMLGLDPARPIVAYALTYIDRLSPVNLVRARYVDRITEAVVHAFAGLAGRHPDWQFVLRPHPNDPEAPRYLKELAEQMGLTSFTVDTLTSAVAALSMTDVLVCTHSNMGIEAILAGKPVVNCVPDEYCAGVFDEGIGPLFRDDDAAIPVRRVEDIGQAVETAISSATARATFLERRPATMRRFNHANDGKAIDRVCAVMLDMVDRFDRYAPPVDRFPEFERALASMIPPGTRRVRVAGVAAPYVCEAIAETEDIKDVKDIRDVKDAEADAYDVVVLADPIPRTSEALPLLRQARAAICESGVVVAAFRNGEAAEAQEAFEMGAWAPARPGSDPASLARQYTRGGIEALLSDCGLEVEVAAAVTNALAGDAFVCESADAALDSRAVDAWVVRARSR